VIENLTVLVNGRNASTLPDLFPLNDGDVVTLLPPFVGG
jgi:molybdopterin converting factor small subunit